MGPNKQARNFVPVGHNRGNSLLVQVPNNLARNFHATKTYTDGGRPPVQASNFRTKRPILAYLVHWCTNRWEYGPPNIFSDDN